MKYLLFVFFTAFYTVSFSQDPQDPAALQETAKSFMRQGDYPNAVLVLSRALELKPNDLQLSKDLLFANYLNRDFAKALEVGKPLVNRPDADAQSFQMLGLVYKAIAEEKEAEKLYKLGLKKFPQEGVFYGELGELVAGKDPQEAIGLWQKGIEVDPNYSGNYYGAAKHYANSGETVWSILYGEMFLNMESFTGRSTEVKNLLLDQYKKFYLLGYNKQDKKEVESKKGKKGKETVAFIDAVAEVLDKQKSEVALGVTPESLTALRARFILDWYNTYGDNYPFRLFEHQKQLLQEGIFEAYNFWVFGPAANLATYQNWQQYHKDDLNEFMTFIRSKVFKIPQGQHYHNM